MNKNLFLVLSALVTVSSISQAKVCVLELESNVVKNSLAAEQFPRVQNAISTSYVCDERDRIEIQAKETKSELIGKELAYAIKYMNEIVTATPICNMSSNSSSQELNGGSTRTTSRTHHVCIFDDKNR